MGRSMLPVFEARNADLGMARIRLMHGLAVVSQCLLGKAERVARPAGALGPSTPMAVQGNEGQEQVTGRGWLDRGERAFKRMVEWVHVLS
ncbi:MAG: hypothetical protein B9S33_03160 [Pedosphaera sp. Tous-C6FEB]|nr:MAG: hypothetical protein B9S33_03160 [Pedosphaera sp. Tous-C6FEB]